mmetsp:Transcript_25648/g.54791  ORF Transcript_25648/g.54791 Transcript_25648/m.54791 type:complete len:146 (+) Transcript_25648:1310-1747(+)
MIMPDLHWFCLLPGVSLVFIKTLNYLVYRIVASIRESGGRILEELNPDCSHHRCVVLFDGKAQEHDTSSLLNPRLVSVQYHRHVDHIERPMIDDVHLRLVRVGGCCFIDEVGEAAKNSASSLLYSRSVLVFFHRIDYCGDYSRQP